MNAALSDLPTPALVGLGLLLVAQVALTVTALVTLFRTPPERLSTGSRWPWLAIILLVNLVGSIVFLLAGRLPEPVEAPPRRPGRPDATEPQSVQARIIRTLFGSHGPPAATDRPAAVRVRGLTKAYRQTVALDGVDLDVAEGSVFGFLGRNGAGKTTTLRVLLGLARPTAGSAQLLGHDVTSRPDSFQSVAGAVGFLPDVPGYYPWLTARETLQLCARLFRLPPTVAAERIDALLELSGLAGVGQPVGGYSRGMRQRLGIAQALVNAPRLLLLDEPTSALDPLGRKDVLDMIAALRGRTTVFFSTHILGDVERVCDTVAILDAGRVVALGPVEQLKSRYAARRGLLVQVTDRGDEIARALQDEPWVTSVTARQSDPSSGQVGATAGESVLLVQTADQATGQRRIPALVAGLGVGLARFEPVEPTLEDVFVGLVGVTR